MNDHSTPNVGIISRLSQASWVEPFLGALVAIYGILTAHAAYNAGIYGGNSTEHYFVAIADLSDANSYYAEGDANYSFDSSALIQLRIQEQMGAPKPVLDAIKNEMTDLALESIERSKGLDDEYQEEIYYMGEVFTENSDAAFESAQAWDSLGDKYEFLVLMLSVGLGFGAWAALMKPESSTRYIFGSLSVILLAVNVFYNLRLMGETRPDNVPTCWNQTTGTCAEALAGMEEEE